MTTTSQPTEADIKRAAAEVLGHMAFKNGKTRVPAHDANVLELLKGNKIGEGIPVLTAWLRGWDNANLSADIQ